MAESELAIHLLQNLKLDQLHDCKGEGDWSKIIQNLGDFIGKSNGNNGGIFPYLRYCRSLRLRQGENNLENFTQLQSARHSASSWALTNFSLIKKLYTNRYFNIKSRNVSDEFMHITFFIKIGI